MQSRWCRDAEVTFAFVWISKSSGETVILHPIHWWGGNAWFTTTCQSHWWLLFIASIFYTIYLYFLYLFHLGKESYVFNHFRDVEIEFREVQCCTQTQSVSGRIGTQTQACLMSLSPPDHSISSSPVWGLNSVTLMLPLLKICIWAAAWSTTASFSGFLKNSSSNNSSINNYNNTYEYTLSMSQ